MFQTVQCILGLKSSAMGNHNSIDDHLASNFDADEIRRLGKRFCKLDKDNSGSLSVEEFMSIPELKDNPLVQRVVAIIDTDGNGEVDFKGELTLNSDGRA
ncbi:Hypothetical predicted protein [Mytilus galloprovincialis]|uniref:EF-hand domain-containing protein n=1 Tax=Mytilus galloprovincialis TaxID=29158 RepID=A0A8B6HS19_MYTGA